MKKETNNKTLSLKLLGVILALLMLTTVVASAEPVVAAPVKEMSFVERMKVKAEIVKQKAEAIYKEYYSRFFGKQEKQKVATKYYEVRIVRIYE